MRQSAVLPLLMMLGCSTFLYAQAPAKTTLNMAQARAIAQMHAQGKIVKEELEKEQGRWRYSFDIREKGRIHEIGIDAMSAAIVEDAWEEDGADKD